MYSYGPPHMAEQKQDDQLEHTYSSYVRIQDVALKTCQKQWMIGRSGKRGLRISVLAAQHDDDDNDDIYIYIYIYICMYAFIHTYIHTYMGEAQSAGAVEYIDCISAEVSNFPNKCPEFSTKQSDGEALVMMEFWECGVSPHCHCSQVHLGSKC